MPGHKIQKDMHASLVCLVKQLSCILIGSVSRCDLIIIRHIIAGIHKGRIKAGIDPDGITAQLPDVVQL